MTTEDCRDFAQDVKTSDLSPPSQCDDNTVMTTDDYNTVLVTTSPVEQFSLKETKYRRLRYPGNIDHFRQNGVRNYIVKIRLERVH